MVDFSGITTRLSDVHGRDVHAEIVNAYMGRAADPQRFADIVDELWDIAPEINEPYEHLVDWLEFRGYLD
jgi:hypothetical protein